MYEEIALPLTNSRGFGKFIRFDYKVENILDMPLVISPHILELGNPFYTRQALYFLEEVECVIRMMVKSPTGKTEDQKEWRNKIFANFQRATDDSLFEYSLQNFDSRLTTRSDRRSPKHTAEQKFRVSENKYIDIDNGHAGLLYPSAAQQFEDIYRHYLSLISSEIDDPDEVEEEISQLDQFPLSFTHFEPFKFYKTPYTFEELFLISRMMPSSLGLIEHKVEPAKESIAREVYLNMYNQPYLDRARNFPPDKRLELEIIKVSTSYNPILLDFYFAGLSSLSPIVEFRNYYSVIEYFFEDATFSNIKRNLRKKLDNLDEVENLQDFTERLEKLRPPLNESEQLREVIVKYLRKEQLGMFFQQRISKTAKHHFMTYSDMEGDKPIQHLRPDNPEILGLVAKRIYQFRNAIFHSKRTRGGKKAKHFRPFTEEEFDVVQHEALLLRFVAQEIIKQAEIVT